jgi:hypothetical protein
MNYPEMRAQHADQRDRAPSVVARRNRYRTWISLIARRRWSLGETATARDP